MSREPETTRTCAGCGASAPLDTMMTTHHKRTGDMSFCSDDCLDASIKRVWRQLTADEDHARRLIGIPT